MDNKAYQLKARFLQEAEEKAHTAQMLIAAVQLPTGAVELITNTTLIPTKAEYYKTAYDEEFKLKTNPNVHIVGFMFV
jgi:hypothetical protein